MSPIEPDWSFLVSAIESLPDYILSPVMYYPLAQKRGETRLPEGSSRLTIGSVLLALRRVEGLAKTDHQREKLDQIKRKVTRLRDEWRTNWIKKASIEFGYRLNLWQSYLQDLNTSQEKGTSFSQQVRLRVILHLLYGEMDNTDPSLLKFLQTLDDQLKRLSSCAPFIWEPGLEASFPEEPYWFLYVQIT